MQTDKRSGKPRKKEPFLPYTKANGILFLTGLGLIVIGYFALGVKPWNSFVSLNIAPILLVLGYCVVVPIAILYHKKEKKPESAPAATVAGAAEPQGEAKK